MPDKYTKKELVDEVIKARSSKAGPFNSNASEFIKGYYGGEESLKKEIADAKKYSENEMASRHRRGPEMRSDYFEEKDIEDRMFEEVPVSVDPRYGASYSPKEESVSTGGTRAARIDLANTKLKLKWKGREETLKKTHGFGIDLKSRLKNWEDNMILNEFKNFGDSVGLEDGEVEGATLDSIVDKKIGVGIEHEMGHKVYRPNKEVQYPVSAELKRSYFDKKHELFQALGKFQREYFKETGKRVTEPEQLYNLIKSEDDLNYLSKEGSRLINYLRKEGKGSEGEKVLKFVSELAPMFVSNDNNSYADSVENRLS